MWKPIESNDVPLLILQYSFLFDQILSNTKVTTLSISLKVSLHLRKHKHKKRRILLWKHIHRIFLVGSLIYFEYLCPYLGIVFSQILSNGFDRLMKFPKATEHVVEMAIIDVIHLLEMDFELIYGHIFRRILHDLEYLDHIVLPFLFLGVISMVMSIVEVYQLKSLVSWIHLQKFHLLLMATLDALRVQIGSIVSFETITMQLDSYSIFLAFLC